MSDGQQPAADAPHGGLEAEYSRQLNALYDALAEVVPAAQLQEDYEDLLGWQGEVGEWPYLEQRGIYDVEENPDGISAAMWEAVRHNPTVRNAIEAIQTIERIERIERVDDNTDDELADASFTAASGADLDEWEMPLEPMPPARTEAELIEHLNAEGQYLRGNGADTVGHYYQYVAERIEALGLDAAIAELREQAVRGEDYRGVPIDLLVEHLVVAPVDSDQ